MSLYRPGSAIGSGLMLKSARFRQSTALRDIGTRAGTIAVIFPTMFELMGVKSGGWTPTYCL